MRTMHTPYTPGESARTTARRWNMKLGTAAQYQNGELNGDEFCIHDQDADGYGLHPFSEVIDCEIAEPVDGYVRLYLSSRAYVVPADHPIFYR